MSTEITNPQVKEQGQTELDGNAAANAAENASVVDKQAEALKTMSLDDLPVSHLLSPAPPRSSQRRRIINHIATGAMYLSFVVAMIPLASLLWITISHGYKRISPYFLTVSMNGVFGGMDAGGIYHAILGTLLITGCAALISVPIGLFTAVYLTEYGGEGRLARWTRTIVDVMTGIPSIVAGLFAAAVFTLLVGPAYRAGIMGAVALSVLMVPTVVRGCEEMLRLVPGDLREAAYALGVPKWRVVTGVVLRTAAGGIATAIMLAVARVIGETAPLLMTVGVLDQINGNVFEGRMMTLPVYVYRQYSQGLVPCRPGAVDCIATINYDRAWAAALVLIVIVMGLNVIARAVAAWLAPKGRR